MMCCTNLHLLYLLTDYFTYLLLYLLTTLLYSANKSVYLGNKLFCWNVLEIKHVWFH